MAYNWRSILASSIFIFMVSGVLFFPVIVQAKYLPLMPSAPGEPENGKISFYEPPWDTQIDLAGGKDGKLDFHIRGERWSYRTTLGDTIETQQESIRDWLSKTKCTVLADIPGHMIGRIHQAVGETLTYYFKISSSTTNVEVYLERHLTADNDITMAIGKDGREGFDFWVDHDGKNFQSMVVEFENDWVYLNGITKSKFNDYERSINHRNDCRIEHGSRQDIFDIPQYAGPYKWRMSTRSKKPQTVKISLVSGPPLPELLDGPGLGAVRVRNLPFGSVQLKPEWDPSLRHPGFQKGTMRADDLWKKDKKKEASDLYKKAITIYTGHLLAEEGGKPWIIPMRERLKNLFLTAITKLGMHWEQEKEFKTAIEYYTKGLAVDNLEEIFYQRLMVCFLDLGRYADAAKVYRRCRNTLKKILGVVPSEHTEELYKKIRQ